MATKQFNSRIQWKKDTASNWTKNNPVLLNGEIAIVVTNANETRFKIGDGTSNYTQLPFQDEYIQNEITNVDNALTTHEENTNNPHNVVSNQVSYTPTQGGVIQDTNVQDALETVEAGFTGLSTSLTAVANELRSHEGNTSNPHSVTKEQVGLGNVDNVKQYSASNPPPYPVTSVNGDTGTVNLTATDVGALPTTGGTMTGPLTLSGNPSANLQAATKQYVDTAIAGIDIPESAQKYSGTLPTSGWTTSGSQRYYQVSISGMTADKIILAIPQWSNQTNQQDSWNNIVNIQSYAGYVRFYASTAPSVSINYTLIYY